MTDTEILNDQSLSWLERTGNAMVHNATRKVPQEQWLHERPFLRRWMPLLATVKSNGHKVLKTKTIKYRGNSYSLPFGTYRNDETRVYVTEEDNQLIIKDAVGSMITTHLIPHGVGNNIINTNHRRDTSMKLDALHGMVKEFFGHSGDIDKRRSILCIRAMSGTSLRRFCWQLRRADSSGPR